MNCPECDKPMAIVAISEHWCFDCDAIFCGWECKGCRIRKKTGCPHVEAEPFEKAPTEEQVRDRLREIFEGET